MGKDQRAPLTAADNSFLLSNLFLEKARHYLQLLAVAVLTSELLLEVPPCQNDDIKRRHVDSSWKFWKDTSGRHGLIALV